MQLSRTHRIGRERTRSLEKPNAPPNGLAAQLHPRATLARAKPRRLAARRIPRWNGRPWVSWLGGGPVELSTRRWSFIVRR